jgi:hypothetical protein
MSPGRLRLPIMVPNGRARARGHGPDGPARRVRMQTLIVGRDITGISAFT